MPNPVDDTAPFVAASAQIASDVTLRSGVRVWDFAQIREGAQVGEQTIIGRAVYVDRGVTIGDRCKIQNAAQIFSPARIGDGVFIGPGAILTNDRYPRAIDPDGSLKNRNAWTPLGVSVETGAAIGAGAVIIGGITIGKWAVIGAGAIVTNDVDSHALVVGSPARRVAWVGKSGRTLVPDSDGQLVDPVTDERFSTVNDILVVDE